jgi:hypothetical protein
MMKKTIILVLVLGLLPLALFADFGIGGAAFYNSPVLIGQDVPTSTEGIGLEDFTFGGNARFKLSLFQLDALALLTLGDAAHVQGFADAEVCVDLLILRLSAGAGPKIDYYFDSGDFETGFNAKANADVKLGKISVGLSYIVDMTIDNGISLDKSTGMLGATVMFWK